MTVNRRASLALVISVLALAVIPGVGLSGDSNLLAAGAWIRQPPPGTDVASVYFSLKNVGIEAVKLTGVECPVASMAMLHQSQESGGQSRMRALSVVALAPGASIAFTPGGRHVMLQGLAHPLQVGERVPLVLLFSGGIRLHITAIVRPLGAG